jgi:hypothetical protein
VCNALDPSGSEVVVVGSDQDQAFIREILVQIADIDPRFRRMIEELYNSKYVYKLYVVSSGGGSGLFVPDSELDSTNGTGSGGTVGISVPVGTGSPSDEDISTFVHELFHGWKAKDGKSTGGSKDRSDPYKIDPEENQAVQAENIWRKLRGLKIIRKYGGYWHVHDPEEDPYACPK